MLYRVAALALVATLCSGCIRSATLIKVKADGSGTVEQTMLMNLGMMKGMFSGLGNQTAAPGAINEADLRRAAERMGEGVTFVSAKPIKADDGFEGTLSTFAFTDVSKLKVDQDPNTAGATAGGFSTPPPTSKPVTFAFTKGQGAASTLTVTVADNLGQKDPTATPTGGPDMDNPQMLDMMRSMFKGFKIGIDIEVAGQIVKTNADHVAGSRVTLLEMDMEALLRDDATLKQIQKSLGPGASVTELKPYLKNVKGLKINDPVVTISFR